MKSVGVIKQLQFLKALCNAGDIAGEVVGTGARRRRWAVNRLNDRYGHSKYKPHQGPRECARRRRQREAQAARDAEVERLWAVVRDAIERFASNEAVP